MNDVVAPTEEPRIQAFGPEMEGTQGTGPDESSEVKKLRLREIEQRAEASTDPDEKIASWVQIGAEVDREFNAGGAVDAGLLARILKRTALEWPGGAPKWIERVVRGVENPRECLAALISALNQEGIEAPIAEQLAQALSEAAPDRKSMIEVLEVYGDVLERRLSEPLRAAVKFREAAEHCAPDEIEETIRLLERARAANPRDAELELRLVDLHARALDFKSLRLAVRRLAELRPDPSELSSLLLSLEPAAIAAGAPEGYASIVDELLPELVSKDSARARALGAAKARVLLASKRAEEAASIYEELIETYADDEDVRAYVGLLELPAAPEWWRREKRRWLFEWRAATTADPVSVMMHWARVEEREFEDSGAALRTLERALEQAPLRSDTLLALSRLKLLSGDTAGGLEVLARLRSAEGPSRVPLAELELARELIAAGRAPIAFDVVASVLGHDSSNARARELALELVARPETCVRAAELVLESASATSPAARALSLGALLETTEPLSKLDSAPSELGALRQGWLTQALKVDAGAETLAVLERAASGLGRDPDAWQVIEERALERGDPLSLVRAYERALASADDAPTVEWLVKRLIRVVEQHLSDPRALTTGLLRVLTVQPDARWAFDRVKLSLSLERRWEDLFPLYERMIAAEKDQGERAALLDEAAVAARDVASDPERAMRFWEEYLTLRPRDGRVDVALERLYERQRRLDKLSEHLLRRESSLSGAELVRLRERIAGLELETGDGRGALAVLEDLLKLGDPSESALALLERVLSLELPEGAPAEAVEAQRQAAKRAARLLHKEYLTRSELGSAARVLSEELSRASDETERVRLLRELYDLSEQRGDGRASFDALGQLLLAEPDVLKHKGRLADLAVEIGALGELSELEVQAAGRVSEEARFVELLRDAARIELGLGNVERAIALEQRVLDDARTPEHQLAAARALERLFAEAARHEARYAMLERLAQLEPASERKREVLLESARVALDDIGDPIRAAVAFRSLLDETPGDAQLLDGWVRALTQTEHHAELVQALRARADATSDLALAREDLGCAARLQADKLGNPEGAIESWRAIRSRFGRDAESFEALSALLESRGRWHELAELIADEAESGRGHGLLLTRLAEVHAAHTGDLRAALSAYRRAGELDRAAELLCETPSLLSDDPSSVLELASELVKKGRLSRAERVLVKQLSHYGQRRPKEAALVHVALSDVLCRADRQSEGLAELVLAAERHPSNAAVLSALGALAFERGELERAEQSYQALLVLIPHYPEAAKVSARAELYLALSELSRRRDEPEKADDQIEWAFEAALGSETEAVALERGLLRREWHPLLERAIRARLERSTEAEQRLDALADLVEARGRAGGVDAALREQAKRLGSELEPELLGRSEGARAACQRLIAVYDALPEPELALSLVERLLSRSGDADSLELELELARRLLALPSRAEEGGERLWALVRRDARCAEAAEVLAGSPAGRGRLDELVSLLDDHATLAAAEGRAADAKALRWRIARVLSKAGRREDALHAYLPLTDDEVYKHDARRRALELLEELEAPPEDLADAVDALLAVSEGPESAELAARLVALAEELGDAEYLERGLERGFSADPGRADLRERLLEVLDQRGEWVRVRDVLERAIERAPEPELVLRLADAHLQTGAPDRALDLLDTVGLRVAPARAVRRRRAATLEAAGRTEEALEELLQLNQTYGDASEEIGSAIRRTRIWADSERWALAAIETSSASDQHELDEIVAHWVERGAHSAALLWQLGELSKRAGDPARAATVYRRLGDIEQGDQRYLALVALSQSLEASGDSDAAVRVLENALGRTPDVAELHTALYELCGRRGERSKQARLLLDRALRAEPRERQTLLYEAAEFLSGEGAHEEALEALSRLEALEPDHLDGTVLKARVLRRLGRISEAFSLIQRVVHGESRPRGRPMARAFRELAEIHLAVDELCEAYQALSSAYQLDRADTDTAWVFGMLAFELDQNESAAAALRAFLTLREHGAERKADPRVASAYARLACIEQDRGQTASARRLLSLAVQAEPHNAEVQRLLAALGSA
jgi:hypothetical protein